MEKMDSAISSPQGVLKNLVQFPQDGESDQPGPSTIPDDKDSTPNATENAEKEPKPTDPDGKPRRSTRQAAPKPPKTHEITGSPDLLDDDADDWTPPEKPKRRKPATTSTPRRRRSAPRRQMEENGDAKTPIGKMRGRPRRKVPTPVHIPTEGEFDVYDEDKTPSPTPPPPPPPPPPPRRVRKPATKKIAPVVVVTKTPSPVISALSLRPRKAKASLEQTTPSKGGKKQVKSKQEIPTSSYSVNMETRPLEDYPQGINFDFSELIPSDPSMAPEVMDQLEAILNANRYLTDDDDDDDVYQAEPERYYDESDQFYAVERNNLAESNEYLSEVADGRISQDAQFAKRQSDSPEAMDEQQSLVNSDDDAEVVFSYERAMQSGFVVDDDEDTRKFYEDLGLSDDMDAEVAAITGGKQLPSPFDDVPSALALMKGVRETCDSPDSVSTEYTMIELTMRKLSICGEVIDIPDMLLDDPNIFNAVLTKDAFNMLSDESKTQVMRFAPRGADPQEALNDALTTDKGFFFGTPVELTRKRIVEGYYDLDKPQHLFMLQDNRRVQYDHFIRQYHMRLLKKLLLTRHAILEQAATLPADAPIKINPRDFYNMKKIKKEKEIRERANLRAKMLLKKVLGNDSDSPSDESADEPPIPQESEGRSVHYSNEFGSADLDVYQPHKVRSIKEMLQDYQKLKRKNPHCPSLDTNDITLEKVYERSGLSFQSERNFAQNPYPPPASSPKRRKKRKRVPQESDVDADSPVPSPTPSANDVQI